jgi:hypothetical protein
MTRAISLIASTYVCICSSGKTRHKNVPVYGRLVSHNDKDHSLASHTCGAEWKDCRLL